MATVVTEKLIDDIDGSDATQTVRIAVNGTTVDVDLSTKNARALQRLLKPYLDNGRRVTAAGTKRGGAIGSAKKPQTDRDYDLPSLRAWAKSKRIKIPARGRIPVEVVERFKAEAP